MDVDTQVSTNHAPEGIGGLEVGNHKQQDINSNKRAGRSFDHEDESSVSAVTMWTSHHTDSTGSLASKVAPEQPRQYSKDMSACFGGAKAHSATNPASRSISAQLRVDPRQAHPAGQPISTLSKRLSVPKPPTSEGEWETKEHLIAAALIEGEQREADEAGEAADLPEPGTAIEDYVAYLKQHQRRMSARMHWLIIGVFFFLKCILFVTLVWMLLARLVGPHLLLGWGEPIRRAIALGVDLTPCPLIQTQDVITSIKSERVRLASQRVRDLIQGVAKRNSLAALHPNLYPDLDTNLDGHINMTDFLDDRGLVTKHSVETYLWARYGRAELNSEEWSRIKQMLDVPPEVSGLRPAEFDSLLQRIFFNPVNDAWIMTADTCPVLDMRPGLITPPCGLDKFCRGARCQDLENICTRMDVTPMHGHVSSFGPFYPMLIGGHCFNSVIVSWIGLVPLFVKFGSRTHIQWGRAFILSLCVQLFCGVMAGAYLMLSRGLWPANYIGYGATSFPLVLYMQFAFLGSCMIDFAFCGLASLHWKIWILQKEWVHFRAISLFFLATTWFWAISLFVGGAWMVTHFGRYSAMQSAGVADEIVFSIMFLFHAPCYMLFTLNAYIYWLRPLRLSNACAVRVIRVILPGQIKDMGGPSLRTKEYRLRMWALHHGRCMKAVCALATITFFANVGYRVAPALTPVLWISVQVVHLVWNFREARKLARARAVLKDQARDKDVVYRGLLDSAANGDEDDEKNDQAEKGRKASRSGNMDIPAFLRPLTGSWDNFQFRLPTTRPATPKHTPSQATDRDSNTLLALRDTIEHAKAVKREKAKQLRALNKYGTVMINTKAYGI